MHSNWMIWFPVFSSCSSSCNKEYYEWKIWYIWEKKGALWWKYIYILCSKNEIWREIMFKSGGVRIRCKNTARWLLYIFLFLFQAKNSAYIIEDYVLFAQDTYGKTTLLILDCMIRKIAMALHRNTDTTLHTAAKCIKIVILKNQKIMDE